MHTYVTGETADLKFEAAESSQPKFDTRKDTFITHTHTTQRYYLASARCNSTKPTAAHGTNRDDTTLFYLQPQYSETAGSAAAFCVCNLPYEY